MKTSPDAIWIVISPNRLKYAPSVPSVVFCGSGAEAEAQQEAKRLNREFKFAGDEAVSAQPLPVLIQAMQAVAADPWL